ncbi:hypothetical protein FEM48_Zijuj09G0114400 [Ziziphus jujuba var. spinosa]|uniref:Cytochrome P450 CYP82D47-like n=1 Tax=Ziziphus jujuba var. spinosa TaxID=714518 RepID=A0A978USR2_ZIZJJ|nr:hypothetical protein FEM48_Zijuj09G0114400 [Ziziphus jujuba var. spinosa]
MSAGSFLNSNRNPSSTRGPKSSAVELVGYDHAMLGALSYGPYWRDMRKLATELYENCIEHGGQVLMEMKEKFEDLAMNIRVRMLAGKRYFGTSSDDQESRQCQEALRCLSYIAGMFMASDTVPFLGWLDVVKGFVRETKKTARELDCMKESLSVLEVNTVIEAYCLSLILGGNDTTLITLTWAISLLLNNPQKLKKAQDELDIHVGKRCQANQSDIKNLLYSEAICDSSIWSNSLEFQQERFLTEHAHLDVKRLLHGYNLEMSLSDKLVDMGESPGMTIPKGNTIGGHIDPKATFSAL